MKMIERIKQTLYYINVGRVSLVPYWSPQKAAAGALTLPTDGNTRYRRWMNKVKPHGAKYWFIRWAKPKREDDISPVMDTFLAQILLFATIFREMISSPMVDWFSFQGWDKALLLHQTFLITNSGMELVARDFQTTHPS